MKSGYIVPVYCFAAFALWLVAVAMDGPLPAAINIDNASGAFLPVHIACLLLTGLFCPENIFRRLFPACCVLTAALIMLLPAANPSAGPWIMAPMGATGAVMAIGACMILRQSPGPLLSAAIGLAAANLLLLPLMAGPAGSAWYFAAVALLLLAIPVLASRLPDIKNADNMAAGAWHYLPFILIFKIICGLMYSFIMPVYHQHALLPGLELVFYVLAVFAGYRIIRKNRDLALICGVVLGMAAFTLMQTEAGLYPANSGMFILQASTGFVDIVLISILLAMPRPVRAFGIGLAVICTGIITGKIMGHYFGNMSETIVMAGHFVLNLSVLTLYFLGRYGYIENRKTTGIDAPAENADVGTNTEALPGTWQDTCPEDSPVPTEDGREPEPDEIMPRYLRLLLSDREYLVLKNIMSGSTYKETACELEISESTVKTYMHRVYGKVGVNGKKELFERLNDL